jgi:release factor glutamine methyltransferase
VEKAGIVRQLRAAGCVYAEDEARLLAETASSPAELASMVSSRLAGLPLEQVVGWAEFCGTRIAVRPGVFVPRRRTQLLARQAISLVKQGSVVLDMCCGTGAVGAVVARAAERDAAGVDLHAVDVDPVAIACARDNVAGLGAVYEGDLYDALPPALRGTVDIILANAPYVPTDAIALMPPEARDHEPLHALDGGHDGLDIQRRVIAEAPQWLRPKGYLLIETSQRQSPETVRAFRRHGFTARVAASAQLDATIVVGRHV